MPGLPNTRIIPPGWEAHHRPIIEGAMIATCTITRPSSTPNAWDDAAGRNIYPAPTPVYDGSCYAWQQGDGAPTTVADRDITTATVGIGLPASAPGIQVNDILTITVCGGNPGVVGKPMRVTGVQEGSTLMWQQDLTCQLQLPTTR